MLRLYIAAAVLAASLGGFGVYKVHSLYTENTRLAEANAALQGDLDRIATERAQAELVAEKHAKMITALRGQQERARANLSKAITQNPDWADERVPDDVARALGL